MPIKAIARHLGIARNPVRAAVRSDGPPKYERRPAGSAVDAFEPRIRELLAQYPAMPATVIAERVGWERGLTVLKERVRELRPAYLPPDPASRTAYDPGELGQCVFWSPPVTVPVGFGQERGAVRLPVLTMVSGYSRWLSAVLVPSRHAQDLFAGWWQLISRLGGGRRGGDRPVAGRQARADGGVPGVPRHPGDPGDRLPPGRPGGQGAGGAGERLPGDLVPSRPEVRLRGRLQRPARGVVLDGQRAGAAGAGLRPGRPDRRRPPRDAGAAAGRAGDRVAGVAAAAPGLLRPPRRQRLLGAPGGDRPADRGGGRAGPGAGALRRPGRRGPRAVLGLAPGHHRPGAPGRRDGAAPAAGRDAPPRGARA